jgi:hypothetical protein
MYIKVLTFTGMGAEIEHGPKQLKMSECTEERAEEPQGLILDLQHTQRFAEMQRQ